MNATKKILIIEDNEDLLHMLSNTLRGEGFLVVETKDGLQGFKIAQEEHPDLILLDLDIPGIDGLTFLKKLRGDKKNKDTPVIIFSNSADIKNISEAMEQDVFCYLVKSDWELNGVIGKVKEALK